MEFPDFNCFAGTSEAYLKNQLHTRIFKIILIAIVVKTMFTYIAHNFKKTYL